MKPKKIFVSPAHIIDIAIISIILLLSIISLLFCYCIFEFEIVAFVSIFVSLLIITIVVSIATVVSLKGCAYVLMDECFVKSYLFGKEILSLSWQGIDHIAIVKSYNYGMDIKPIYLVISNEIISGKNLAASYDKYKQIVVRISKRNFDTVKAIVADALGEDILGSDFKHLQSRAIDHDIKLSKDADGKWM